MTAVLASDTSLRERLEAAWERSDSIFALLTDQALLARPIALRQPFIFYVGHLPAFGWNQVWRGVLGREPFDPAFDALFQRGIDPVGVDAYEPANPADWPPPAQVLAYRDRVRDAIRAAFGDVAALEGRDVLADRGRIWQIVIEHELMHHETLLYMIQQLPPALKLKPRDLPAYRTQGAAANGDVPVPGGAVTLGADFERTQFGWDNEFPEHHTRVASLTMDRTPVRNTEYLEFMEAGGYERAELWAEDDWAWRLRVGHDHPTFWVRGGAGWRYRTLFDELPLDQVADWPVYVSWAEAKAYAQWKGAALPTEAELHRAAYGTQDGGSRAYPWGDTAPAPEHGNFGFRNWAPTPVGAHPAGASAWGVLDLVGNGWEWTESRFGPFPGFKAYARTYAGYSADFFDDQHYVMLGASYATDPALVRRSFRNWFQPHYPYVFAKFRCVRRA
ncbi:MAG: SUMF1/EgtB/PvdO family nonheme iron enzyme [Gemmatimonadales bacterium]|nr:SUMF1/EgtB/PvdO family nonheme iron enzyme [Gemmatimonadales bacterium]